ncbi:nuclear transport factor 2 family protein [Orrella sp. JC864]|uniref:nuclear transport factor 2 family protein n=1 Tax=Orrella sp. JC864 TaxID=3120298 RepID=UPI00300AB22C
MEMPPVVQAYFQADKGSDDQALAQAFAADAVVRDEGIPHEGAAAIRAWWLAAKEKYGHVAEPQESRSAHGKIHIRARVTGRFPGSPAMLDFVFTLEGGRIARLEIG